MILLRNFETFINQEFLGDKLKIYFMNCKLISAACTLIVIVLIFFTVKHFYEIYLIEKEVIFAMKKIIKNGNIDCKMLGSEGDMLFWGCEEVNTLPSPGSVVFVSVNKKTKKIEISEGR